MKVALVHDYLREWGGAEEVLKALHELWPEAPIYTSYQVVETPADWKVKRSFMQSLPNKSWRGFTPLLPLAFGSFNFDDFDIVVSSSASFAKTVHVKKPTIHICYCHTVPRFLYGLHRERKTSTQLDVLEIPFSRWLKKSDQAAAKRVDYFVANSQVVAGRIKEFYNKEATVIYPPVDITKFQRAQTATKREAYFMTIGRLSAIKHFELAVMACTKLKLPLKVVGEGSELAYLKSLAGPTIEFVGRGSDAQVGALLQECRAVISTVQDEDFGMLPLEVLGAGVPVIAYASQASKETMADGITGKFYYEPTAESLANVLETFDETGYNAQTLQSHAAKFGKDRFASEMKTFVEDKYARTSRS